MQVEEPRSYKTETGEPVQDEGFRVLPIVTEEGLHRCMNFRDGTCSQSIGVCVEGVP